MSINSILVVIILITVYGPFSISNTGHMLRKSYVISDRKEFLADHARQKYTDIK